MKIIFFGSGKFAVQILETLHSQGFDITLVVTKADRKKGRHLHLAATPVKEYALINNLKIFQPRNINDTESLNLLRSKNADILLVVSYGRILSKEILEIPKIVPVNIHASLLPKYRGAAPINRALISGEKTTGITFIKMNERMDEGEIILQKSLRIGRLDNALTLDEKLSNLASKYLPRILNRLRKKNLRTKKQNEKQATYAPLMKKQDGLIRWQETPGQIINNFRGCYGWPGSFTFYRGKILKILSMNEKKHPHKGSPGEILKAKGDCLIVASSGGCVAIHEVLPESHKKMPVRSFLSGHNVKIGEKLGQ